jgi:hypothetical protein
MTEKITIDEIKTLLQEEGIKPQRLFTKEQLLSDPTVILNIEKAAKDGKIPEEAWQEKEDEVKKKEEAEIRAEVEKIRKEKETKQETDKDDFIPDVDDGKPSEDDDLIPD